MDSKAFIALLSPLLSSPAVIPAPTARNPRRWRPGWRCN